MGDSVLSAIDQGHCLLIAFRKLLKLEPFVTGVSVQYQSLGGTRIYLLTSEKNEPIHPHIDFTNIY